MTIRIASLSKQIQKTGARLHLAMLSRVHSQGLDHEPSETERALADERRRLKEAQAERQAQGRLPKKKTAKAVKTTTRTPKAPKAVKEPKAQKEPRQAKTAKDNKPTRADKVAKKAENLEAAKNAAKKSAKT
jgi:hypothetical protein